jgi:hypothetical protein
MAVAMALCSFDTLANVFYIELSRDRICHETTINAKSISDEIASAKKAFGADLTIISEPKYNDKFGGKLAFIDTDHVDNTGMVALFDGTLKQCKALADSYRKLREGLAKIKEEKTVMLDMNKWEFQYQAGDKSIYKPKGYYQDGKTGIVEGLIISDEVNADNRDGIKSKSSIISYAVDCINKTAFFSRIGYFDEKGILIKLVEVNDDPFKYEDALIFPAAFVACGGKNET